MIKALATFVLIGTVDSMDSQFATVEINYNPATLQPAAMAVLPVSAFPCEIEEGDNFYILKTDPNKPATILCIYDEGNTCSCIDGVECDEL